MTMKKFVWGVTLAMCLCTFVLGGAGKSARNLDGDERPFEIFTCEEELQRYRTDHDGDFFNLTDREYARFDKKFFQSNALVMFLTQGMSGSIRCVAEDFRLENNTLVVTVKELSPPMHTMDLRYNTLFVAMPRDLARNVTAVVIRSYRVESQRQSNPDKVLDKSSRL